MGIDKKPLSIRFGCFQKIRGKTPKCMVKKMENPILKMDDLGIPLFLEIPIYKDPGIQ